MSKLKNTKAIFIAFLLGIALYTSYKYLSMLKERYLLVNSMNEIKSQLAGAEKEKQNLLQQIQKEREIQSRLREEKNSIKEYLIASKKRMGKIFRDYAQAQQAIDDLNTKISLLKEENSSLSEEKSKLGEENEQLRSKLNSVDELKKAMTELKKQAYKVVGQIKEKVNENKLIEGNRGFLLKNGRSTVPAKVKIEVIPAATKQ